MTVYLDAEARRAWQYLRQHLAADSVWESIDAWKIAMERDLEARLCLLRTIARLIQRPVDEGGLGLPMLDIYSNDFQRCPSPAVSQQYAFALLVQLICQALKMNDGPQVRDSFRFAHSNTITLGSDWIIWSPDAAQREAAVNYFLNMQDRWVSLPETRTAADAYRLAEEKTVEVKGHLERLELAQVFPGGSICDGCSEWNI